MQIKKDELKEIASQLRIDLHDDELDKINDAIAKITDKLNEIFNEETTEYAIRTMAPNEHDVTKKAQLFEQQVNMQTVNNYKDGFVNIKKENHEEE